MPLTGQVETGYEVLGDKVARGARFDQSGGCNGLN